MTAWFAKYVLRLPDPVREGPPIFDEDEDFESVYEQRARVDQVLQFFEYEWGKYEQYIEADERLSEELEQHRIQYYNSINAIEFQAEQIAYLVDELLELRQEFRELHPSERKEVCIKLAHVKLDIGDRKTKRRNKEKERLKILEQVTPMLTEIKLNRLLEEEKYREQEAEVCESSFGRGSNSYSGLSTMDSEESVMSSSFERSSCTRKRYKHYTDDELTALLKVKDE